MNFLTVKSYLLLIRVQIVLKRYGFKRLHDTVRELQTEDIPESKRIPCESLCHAIDLACVFYPKTVFCLQRSAAAILLLRPHGWPAELVTGCALGILENHAWVEVNGQIVNDKPYMHEMYEVLDRC